MTDQPPLIGNDPTGPGFDPAAPRRLIARRNRGRRFRALLLLAGGLGVLGLVLFQGWWQGWRSDKAAAQVDIRPVTAQPPDYRIEQANMPVYTPPPAPEQHVAEPAQATVRRPASRSARARDNGPRSMTWQVQVQGEPPNDWFMDGRRPMLAYGCALRPGASLIPAVLNTVVDSTVVPGQVIATVSEDVFDADGVGRLLIPQGTKVVGAYNKSLEFGQERLGIIWTQATMPDGTQLNLDESNGMDVAGSQGMGGDVQTNWGRLIAVATIFSIFDVAQSQTVPDGTWSGDLANSAANEYSRVGRDVVRKILNSAVVIRIPAGTQLTVSVGKTLRVC